MGPALIEFGLDPIASHLFILYWGMISYITPPVALAAVAASVIARSNQMETAMVAMRLGSIKFVLPFVLVLTPALIMRGEPWDIVVTISATTIAVFFMAFGFEGWAYGVGKISRGWKTVFFLGAAGFRYQDVRSYVVAAVVMSVLYGYLIVRARTQGPTLNPG